MSSQTWNANQYATHAGFVPALGEPVFDLLAPRAHERILDLGCGDGVLTRRLADLGCEVTGVDASPGMIANAALHWMRDPDRVVARVFRALRPGGRFVGECGADGNVATLVVALEAALAARGVDPRPHNPWHFASGEEHRARLARAASKCARSKSFGDRRRCLATSSAGSRRLRHRSWKRCRPRSVRPTSMRSRSVAVPRSAMRRASAWPTTSA